jgi:hypothetical protein
MKAASRQCACCGRNVRGKTTVCSVQCRGELRAARRWAQQSSVDRSKPVRNASERRFLRRHTEVGESKFLS